MFTNDVVGNLRQKKLSDRAEVWLARGFVVAIVAITYLLCLATGFKASVFSMAIWCFSGFAGLFPIVLAALYWRRLTAGGVLAGLLTAVGSWTYLFYLSYWGATEDFVVAIGPDEISVMPVVLIFVCTTIAMVLASVVTRRPSQQTISKFFN